MTFINRVFLLYHVNKTRYLKYISSFVSLAKKV